MLLAVVLVATAAVGAAAQKMAHPSASAQFVGTVTTFDPSGKLASHGVALLVNRSLDFAAGTMRSDVMSVFNGQVAQQSLMGTFDASSGSFTLKNDNLNLQGTVYVDGADHKMGLLGSGTYSSNGQQVQLTQAGMTTVGPQAKDETIQSMFANGKVVAIDTISMNRIDGAAYASLAKALAANAVRVKNDDKLSRFAVFGPIV